MNLLLIILFVIVAYITLLKITSPYREKKREEKCEYLLQEIKQMLDKMQYLEILDRINKENVLRWEYKLPPDLRRRIAEIKLTCFEKLGKTEEAVIDLTGHLASTYGKNEWPNDLYAKWLELYKSIDPLPVEKFYFCECCGLHPDTKILLDSGIEKGCSPPLRYPGECKSAVVIHFGTKKAKKK